MKRQKRLLLWMVGIISLSLFISILIWNIVISPKVTMIYYSSKGKKMKDYQRLYTHLVKRYGKDVALVRQYFEGSLSLALEVWFLEAKVLGVWVISPRQPKHLVINLSKEFYFDLQRHPLLVQRWLEGLFYTLRENKRPIEKCSIMVEGAYEKLWVGRWNLYYPIPLKR